MSSCESKRHCVIMSPVFAASHIKVLISRSHVQKYFHRSLKFCGPCDRDVNGASDHLFQSLLFRMRLLLLLKTNCSEKNSKSMTAPANFWSIMFAWCQSDRVYNVVSRYFCVCCANNSKTKFSATFKKLKIYKIQYKLFYITSK